MARKRDLTSEEREIFRQAVSGTRKILPRNITHGKITPEKIRPAPIPLPTTIQDQQQVLQDILPEHLNAADLETGEELFFSRGGLQHRALRKLRRGGYTIQSELDLHGLTRHEALTTLAHFLANNAQNGVRCVLIIHGKGHGSQHKNPVLKGLVNQWLQKYEKVLAFCSAQPIDGGTGAVYVLLKKQK